MEQDELYQKIREEHISLPSQMILTPYDDIANYQYDSLLERLMRIDWMKEIDFKEEDGILKGSFMVENKQYTCGFIYEPFEDDGYMRYIYEISEFAHLPENGLPRLKDANGNIVFFMDYHEDVRADYLVQLRILTSLSEHIALIYDESGYKILTMEQVNYILSMHTMPSYDVLYSVHIIYDPDGTYWLHTHGLHRCGMIELEIIKVKENIHEYFELLHATAKRYLEEGLPSEDQAMCVGYASMISLDVKWTPWEKALKQETKHHLFQKKAEFCGSYKDRLDAHTSPSGILYAYYEHTFQPLHVYDRFLSDNAILYISNAETARMASYAKEALPHFRLIFDEHKEDKEAIVFMIKAGMDVDVEDEICGEKEHLWFEIQEMKETSFLGELNNEPYGIANMKCGEIYEIALSRISDFLILRRDQANLNPNTMYVYYMEHPMN